MIYFKQQINLNLFYYYFLDSCLKKSKKPGLKSVKNLLKTEKRTKLFNKMSKHEKRCHVTHNLWQDKNLFKEIQIKNINFLSNKKKTIKFSGYIYK